MTHRGTRSPQGQARYETRRYLFTVSYHDKILEETVSTIDVAIPVKVWREDGSYSWDTAFVDRGDVMLDSRGRGTFQHE